MLHDITILFIVSTYFASFTGYEDDIFKVISNLHVEGSKFGRKNYKFGEKSLKKLNSMEFMDFFSFKSATMCRRHRVVTVAVAVTGDMAVTVAVTVAVTMSVTVSVTMPVPPFCDID